MLYDVVSPSSYLTFNVTIAHIIGLVNSVYCAELLDIYSKAKRKHKLDDEGFFVLNRDYVKLRTSIKVDEQYLCDASLSKVDLIQTSIESPDKIRFDVSRFMQLIAEEDSKVLSQISKKVHMTKNDSDAKELKKANIKQKLKAVINYGNARIDNALSEWVDVVFDTKPITSDTVKDFQNTLKEYANSDVEVALRIVTIARVQNWTNCVYAIESYEKEQKVLSKNKQVKTTKLKVATSDNLSNKRY